jgi:hypothetical protein
VNHPRRHAAVQAGAELWSFAWPLLAGLLIGALLAHSLQRKGLRWSWALLGIPLACVAWLIEWHFGLLFSAATAAATYIGVWTHAEALQHGGEEAREKRNASGPLRFLRSRLSIRRAKAQRQDRGSLALGITRRGGVCRVPIGEDHGVHALVLGATGSGKTVTQAAIAQAYIRAGKAAIVIDPKGDRDLLYTLLRTAQQTGATFRVWTPTGPNTYNPLARGGPTEIADKALSAHEWSEPHYELATQRLLGHALATMRAAELWPPTLSGLVRLMDPERLHALASEVGGETAERVCSYVNGLSPRGAADLGGGRDRLAVLKESELGPWLDPEQSSGEVIDLAASLQRSEVLYFFLDADRFPVAAKLLGAALLIDLVGLSAERHSGGALLAIDEFAALGAPQVSRLFARARSAGLSLLLGTQSLADLRGARLEDPTDTLTEQVFSNIEFAVVHRSADPDSAERLARFAGTVPAWTVTQRVSGNGTMLAQGEGTRTREREFLIGPDEFKRLHTGEAIVIDPKATPAAQVVQIWPAQEGAR